MRVIPNIEIEGYRGHEEITMGARQLAKRRVFLFGTIDTDMVHSIEQQLMFLADEDQDAPIQIYIDSPGGEVDSGLVIFDLLQTIPCPVDITATGMAASMAAVILAGGRKGHRFILPHSRTMIHEPLIGGSFGGSASNVRATAESIMNVERLLTGIIAEHTGRTESEVIRAMSEEKFMNAEESVKFGLCDAVRESVF